MSVQNDRRKRDRKENSERNTQDVTRGLGSIEGEGVSTWNKSNTVFYSDSEGRNQNRPRNTSGGQETLGGIHRRLKQLHQDCLHLVESNNRQLENSLHESKRLTEEISDLETLLAEALIDISEE
nr:hypothetical protein [Nostoc sp. SerVER01]